MTHERHEELAFWGLCFVEGEPAKSMTSELRDFNRARNYVLVEGERTPGVMSLAQVVAYRICHTTKRHQAEAHAVY